VIHVFLYLSVLATAHGGRSPTPASDLAAGILMGLLCVFMLCATAVPALRFFRWGHGRAAYEMTAVGAACAACFLGAMSLFAVNRGAQLHIIDGHGNALLGTAFVLFLIGAFHDAIYQCRRRRLRRLEKPLQFNEFEPPRG
jgi:divalent metal cation (Fe/Co/Zn/Cd) transporter